MEDFFLQGFKAIVQEQRQEVEGLKRAHEEEVSQLKAELQQLNTTVKKQKVCWARDTAVSDNTSFLYNTWIDDYKENPAVARLLEEEEQPLNGTSAPPPPQSNVNKIMCLLYSLERSDLQARTKNSELEVARLKAELASKDVLLKERTEHLARLAPIDKILEQNAFFQGQTMEMGRRIIELEDFVKKVEEIVVLRTEENSAAIRAEAERRRHIAHDILNTIHIELVTLLQETFTSKEVLTVRDKVDLQDVLVHHLERVRLVIFGT